MNGGKGIHVIILQSDILTQKINYELKFSIEFTNDYFLHWKVDLKKISWMKKKLIIRFSSKLFSVEWENKGFWLEFFLLV